MAEVQKRERCEYRLLVHYSIINKLHELLKNCTRLKLEEICNRFESEFKHKLIFFITHHKEIVVELSSNNANVALKKPKGWNGLEELIQKIDFRNVLRKSVIKLSQRTLTAADIENYESLHFRCEFISENASSDTVQHLKIFQSHVGKSEIPNFFDLLPWKTSKLYTGFVSNIYDPSKFWIRFAEVERLEKLLYNFYQEKSTDLKLSPSDVCVGLNCAVLLNSRFHRGRIVKTNAKETNSFILFLYDHGMIHKVSLNNLFHLHEKFKVFPALAVRCILSNVSPLDNECWSEKVVARFQELTGYDKELVVKVSHVKIKRKILEVYLGNVKSKSDQRVHTINHILVQEKLAKITSDEPVKTPEHGLFRCLTQFTYLYPTHEMIEGGTAPADIYQTNALKQCVSWDVLFPELYQYKG